MNASTDKDKDTVTIPSRQFHWLERDLLFKMFEGDLEIAVAMVRIGNFDRATDALNNALTKVHQISALVADALVAQGQGANDPTSAIDV